MNPKTDINGTPIPNCVHSNNERRAAAGRLKRDSGEIAHFPGGSIS
jgi:hypothetical protein